MGVKMWAEITDGRSATLSLDAQGGNGGNGGMGLRYARSFRIIYEQPADFYSTDVRDVIGIQIGDSHPDQVLACCDSIDVKQDGDSRTCVLVTASYSVSALSLEQGGMDDNNEDPRSTPPDARPANWSTSTTTIEVPSWWWIPQNGPNAGRPMLCLNPAGDLYDGVTVLQPIVTITVEQYVSGDQTVFSSAVGKVNSNIMRLGSLSMFPRSTLFKGVSSKPHTEVVGKRNWRGWIATFEFVYKPNFNNLLNEYIGWDIIIPVSGFNCINNGLNRNDVEKGALALELTNDDVGSIKNWPNPALAPGLQGEKIRANVLIAGRGEAKAAQRPTPQPIPLNWDGTPRSSKLQPQDLVLVQRSQTYDAFDMSTLGLRLTR